MTRVKQSSFEKSLIHCLIDEDYPFGRARFLWEVSFDVAPIDARDPESSSLRVILATINNTPRGGEEIVSEFLFTSINALMLYSPYPEPPKRLQFERHGAIMFSILVRDGDAGYKGKDGVLRPYQNGNLFKGFSEVYPLLQLSEHTTPEQLLLSKHLREYGHLPKGNPYSIPMQKLTLPGGAIYAKTT